MAVNIHKSDSRGIADHGWLNSRHTFSFASYQNPERMGFGDLLVINDDIVQASMGFGTHPHENMEIISIPLSGSLKHKDSMGNAHIIQTGEVQIMSAGSGITHSEYNNSDSDLVNFLQIWVLPKEKNIDPRYDQKVFPKTDRQNKFQLLVSPEQDSDNIWINQNAYFSMIDLDASKSINYEINEEGNGVYIFMLSGGAEVLSNTLSKRDGMEITGENVISLSAIEDSQILLMEVAI